MRISIVGSGYVGLITALGLANKGHSMTCIDIDKEKVDKINRAQPFFYESGLDKALHDCVKAKGILKATTDYEAILNSDVTFICVDTSSNSHSNSDFKHITQATKKIGEVLKKKDAYHTVVTKSSVIPGTTEELVIPLLEQHSNKKVGYDLGMAVNPEFLQEGNALHSFLKSDRFIIGEYDRKSGDTLASIYSDFHSPILRTEIKTAEMIKFTSNAFLATKISFINEIGNLCKTLGIDVYQVAEGMGYDPRIGRSFLNAGIGFGGSCLPKDLDALCHKFEKMGEKSSLLSAVAQINKAQPMKIIEIAKRQIGEMRNKRIAVLGLAFKPETDDVRNAPSIDIIHQLFNQGAQLKVYDPKAMSNAREVLPQGVQYGDNAIDTIKWADFVLILTEWDEFKDECMYSGKMVLDGRRVLNPTRARNFCQYYEGVCW